MQEEEQPRFVPDHSIFTCTICNDFFEKPVTLTCGHTFCHHCIEIQLRNPHRQTPLASVKSLVPLCPNCRQIIWRPLSQLKDNVVITNLLSRYNLTRKQPHTPIQANTPDNYQYNILLDCIEANALPMPSCYSQVIFSTAFIDQIIEQQSQTHPIMLKWPGCPPDMAIAGKISRPEIYHYSFRHKPHQTTFRAQFEGRNYVRIKQTQQLYVQTSVTSQRGQPIQAPLLLCLSNPQKSINPIPLQKFQLFYSVYDQLNNPIYLRQIAQIVDQKVLNTRSDPQNLIYCILRVLRLSEKQRKSLVQTMDDAQRWQGIENFLIKNLNKAAVEVIKVDIPGNYPHELMLILLLLLLFLFYLWQ